MTGLGKTFGSKSEKRTQGFSLADEIGSGGFNNQAQPTRPSYKAALDERGHVKFTNNKTHVMVTNESASGDRKETEHQLPILAVQRYCDMLQSGAIQAISQEEVKNAEVLSKAVAPHVKLATNKSFAR